MKTANEKSNILIAAGSNRYAAELESRLKAHGYRICGIAPTWEESLCQIDLYRPDLVILLQIDHVGREGKDAVMKIKSKAAIPLLLMTDDTQNESPNLSSATNIHYVSKTCSDHDLISAIETARYVAQLDAARKKAESALLAVAEAGHLSGKEFFRHFVRHAATLQGTRYAMIAMIDEQDPTNAHTIAVWGDNDYLANFSYSLTGTPCENVTKIGSCLYPGNIQNLFPEDELLVEMGVESYWGTPLRNKNQNTIGLLAILDDKPIEKDLLSGPLLESFAARAAAEMERTKFEEELKREGRFLKTVINSLAHPFYVIDANNYEILMANKAAGLHPWNGKTLTCHQLTHNSQKPCDASHPCPLEEVKKSLEPCTVEHIHYDSQGEPRVVEIRGFPIFGPDGKLDKMIEYNLDITERKLAEQAIRESADLLSRTQQIAKVGSWRLDLSNNSLQWSDEVYRIFGLIPQEFEATYEAFLEYVHPDDRAAVDFAYTSSIRDGKDSYEIEHRVVRKDNGEIHNVYEKCVHERDLTGAVVRSIGIVMDITVRKQLEEHRADVERMMRHDLKTPLNAIIGLPQLIEDEKNLTEEQVEFLRLIESSGRHMLKMIDLSLDLYKIEAGNYDCTPSAIDVVAVTKRLIKQNQAQLSANQLPKLSDFLAVRKSINLRIGT